MQKGIKPSDVGFLISLVCFQAVDLLLTSIFLEQSTEANPLAAWLWESTGFAGLATFKLLMTNFAVGVIVYGLHHKPSFTRFGLRVCWVISAIPIFMFIYLIATL